MHLIAAYSLYKKYYLCLYFTFFWNNIKIKKMKHLICYMHLAMLNCHLNVEECIGKCTENECIIKKNIYIFQTTHASAHSSTHSVRRARVMQQVVDVTLFYAS